MPHTQHISRDILSNFFDDLQTLGRRYSAKVTQGRYTAWLRDETDPADAAKADMADVAEKLIRLSHKNDTDIVYLRELSQSFQKKPRIRIDKALNSLEDQGMVEVENTVHSNNKTKRIVLHPEIYRFSAE